MDKYSGSNFKGFSTIDEAEQWLRENGIDEFVLDGRAPEKIEACDGGSDLDDNKPTALYDFPMLHIMCPSRLTSAFQYRW